MGEGWEARRRRDDGNDWALIQLAARGEVRQIEIDTTHFKHNASSHVEVRAIDADHYRTDIEGDQPSPDWALLLSREALQPDTRHVYPVTGPMQGPAAYVRVDAFPDGGLSRVRMFGPVDPAARVDLRARLAQHSSGRSGVRRPDSGRSQQRGRASGHRPAPLQHPGGSERTRCRADHSARRTAGQPPPLIA